MAARAGRLGLPMILGSSGGTLAHARRARPPRGGHSERLRVGISTHFFAGATPEAARAVYPYYHEYRRPKTPGGRGFRVDRAAFEAGTRRASASCRATTSSAGSGSALPAAEWRVRPVG